MFLNRRSGSHLARRWAAVGLTTIGYKSPILALQLTKTETRQVELIHLPTVDDSSDASVVNLDPPPPLDLMPRERGSGAEFNSLVAAICRRSWLALSKIENGVPAAYRGQVSLTKLWSLKERQAYDKMIKHQFPERCRENRRENPLRVACSHRLTFACARPRGPAATSRRAPPWCSPSWRLGLR